MSKYEVRGGMTFTSGRIAEKPKTVVLAQPRSAQQRATLRWEVETARAQMRALQALQEGWDGYGAAAPSQKVRINAWHAFDEAVKLGLIADSSPRSSGTISLEWEIGETEAHLELGERTFSMYVSTPNRSQYFSGEVREGVAQGLRALRAAIDDQEGVLSEPGSRR